MPYQSTIDFPGDASVGLVRLAEIFTPLGFRIERRDAHVLELSGPGMNSSRQSPLLGISRLRAESRGRQLTIEADFKALDRLLRFVVGFILGLFLFLAVLFGFLFRHRPNFHLWTLLLPFAPWPVLLPVIRITVHRRIRRTLDNVLHNCAVMADQPR